MATCTLAARIAIDLRLLTATQRVINASGGPGEGTSEVTTRTAAHARMAAGKVQSVLGDVGSYDDTDGTIGDQEALQWACRWAWKQMSVGFQMQPDDALPQSDAQMLQELADLRAARVDEAAEPVVYDADGEEVTE